MPIPMAKARPDRAGPLSVDELRAAAAAAAAGHEQRDTDFDFSLQQQTQDGADNAAPYSSSQTAARFDSSIFAVDWRGWLRAVTRRASTAC